MILALGLFASLSAGQMMRVSGQLLVTVTAWVQRENLLGFETPRVVGGGLAA
jgi:hypothetical protein